MPKIDFDSGFKKKSYFDYPKLSLEHAEKARICVIDSPTMEYVHTLRKVITEQGRPIMETQKYGKNMEKTREVPMTDFVGKFICLGDLDTLQAKDVDPDKCPACKASLENGAAIDGPRRRFVVHVLKYQTLKDSFNLQKPFQVNLLAWEFTEKRFANLVDIAEEHGSLTKIDLMAGPCINKGYQLYDVSAGGTCQWAQDEDRKAKTRDVVQANRSDDLSPLLGRRLSDTELRGQVVEVVQAYNFAFGQPTEMPSTVDTNADNDLSSMLGGDKPANQPADDPWASEFSQPSQPAEVSAPPSTQASTEPEQPAEKKEEDRPAANADELDLDSILNSL